MRELLFVYGTLRQNANHPMHQQLLQHARFVGMARYQACIYQVSYYPGAVPSSDVAEQVLGEVYQLTNTKLTLAALDRYESCSVECPMPHEYRRELQQVVLENGERVTAWVYLYNRNIDDLAYILSGDFLNQGIE